MRTIMLRVADAEFWARKSITVLVLILLFAGFCAGLTSFVKPFWFDEILTVIVCRLPSASAIWNALGHAADGNPPLFYSVVRLTRQLIPEDHLGYRLPSILGLLATVICIYLVLCKRVDRLSALTGAAFVLCTPMATYASEARPYSPEVACIAGAILAWQRADQSRLYSLLVATTLAAAVSLHYYAVFVWPAFLLAEASVWLFGRRFRLAAWVSLVVGAAPLFLFAGLLSNLRRYYGQHLWAPASIYQMFGAHNWLFGFAGSSLGGSSGSSIGGYWGTALTVGVTLCFVYWGLGRLTPSFPSEDRKARERAFPIGEYVLTMVLLWLPAITLAAAIVSHGGMTTRYMLPTILGGALAVGYFSSRVPRIVTAFLLLLLLVNYGLSSASGVMKMVHGSLREPRATAAREFQTILEQQHESRLPIVISSGIQYLPMAYYTPPDPGRQLYALTDPPAAVIFAKSDSVDLNLIVLRRYFPLQVEDYAGFAPRHREFLLVSTGKGGGDYWPARLSHDGHTLSLLSVSRSGLVYKVTLNP
jgi:hypothetical protein